MLTYVEALTKILENTKTLPATQRRLEDMLGCVLAAPVVARFPMPQFDNSAVDGYGILLKDVDAANADSPVSLKLAGEIQAGTPGTQTLAAGSALKILTGAVVPPSVDAVVMREYCEEKNGSVSVGYLPKQGENIRRRGDEFGEGTEVLQSGVRVTPPVVGLLASLGYRSFPVYERPRAAVIATGDELIEPGKPLMPGQIYDSNSFAMKAALTAYGIEDCDVFHARDSAEATREAFQEALATSDIVVSTGGVSVGDYDYVKDVLEAMGVTTVFWKIAIKPGKPVYFGIFDDTKSGRRKLVFGLPGNPVSSLVTYHQFVKPALAKMAGNKEVTSPRVTAVLTSNVKKKPGRLDFVRATLSFDHDGAKAAPTVGQDSHMISGLAKANSLVHFDAEADKLEQGTSVTVDLLSWWA